ncbi:tetratricopeptide repeat protein [Candidatus Gottesmanbacteria bacterium]|nr:tetratricopeptide repeat protein [Candidatus Gottesmanbacteria bacterium]
MNMSPTADDAIACALAQQWKEAIRINTALLALDKTDIDALCRLAFAYLKTGKLAAAKTNYQNVLALDPYHQIALKNLKRLGTLKRKDVTGDSMQTISPLQFLEEPGKTKIVECVHLAPVAILSTLVSGQEVTLKAKNHCVEVRDAKNRYLAVLPDDISFKLIKFMGAGNRYHALVKGVEKQSLKVFLRETTRGKRFAHQPSFTPVTSYVSFTKGMTAPVSSEITDEEKEENQEE